MEKNIPFSSNHHKEYLVVAAQLGLVGLAVLLYLFFTQWRLARKLSGEVEQATARGLVLMILSASMVSSTLIDHSKGLLYLWIRALLFTGLNTSHDIWECER